jgi:molybdopterin synthase catalytic subunit
MRIKLQTFGVLKETHPARTIELAEGSTVADLLRTLSPALLLHGIAVSVNLEFARAEQTLHDGDEVGLLPPVSGGAPESLIQLTREKIPTEQLIAASKAGEDGAVLIFEGIVRNNSRGRATQYLDYEAYEEMATKQMHELIATAHEKFSVRHIALVHRLGRIEIGETSVLIIVASAHRAAAYEASRWLIDTLKSTVPIWKREVFVDGAEWAPGEPFPSDLGIG